jgi:hypothetical protein
MYDLSVYLCYSKGEMKVALCSLKNDVRRRRFVEGGGGRNTYYKVRLVREESFTFLIWRE